MKKLMIFATLLLVIGITTACDDNEKPITYQQLPQRAQEFIQTYFPNEEISYVMVDKEVLETTYEVFFVSGTNLEFKKNGDWKKVDCRLSPIPAGIVPEPIVARVAQMYPNVDIVQIDRDTRDYDVYEVDLSNGLELTFDRNFNIIGTDN